MSSSGYINVLQWNREWFLSQRIKLDSGFNVMGGMWNFPNVDQKSFIASPATGSESWGCGKDPSDSRTKSTLLSPRIGRCRTKVDVLRSWSPPRVLIRPSDDWEKWIFHFSLEISPPSHWVFLSRFPMRPSSPTPQGLQPSCHPSKFPLAYRPYPGNNPGKTFLSKLMDSRTDPSQGYRVILNQWTKRNDWSFAKVLLFRRETCHQPLNWIGRVWNGRSSYRRKITQIWCFVPGKVRHQVLCIVEVCVWRNGVTFTTSSKVPCHNWAVNAELTDGHDGIHLHFCGELNLFRLPNFWTRLLRMERSTWTQGYPLSWRFLASWPRVLWPSFWFDVFSGLSDTLSVCTAFALLLYFQWTKKSSE